MMTKISGYEAHHLLYAVDHYCATRLSGKITIAPSESFEFWQELRDKLFAAHEHEPTGE